MKKLLLNLILITILNITFAKTWIVTVDNKNNKDFYKFPVLINLSKTNMTLDKIYITQNGKKLDFCYLNDGICSNKPSNLILVKVDHLRRGLNKIYISSNYNAEPNKNLTFELNNCHEFYYLNNKTKIVKYLQVNLHGFQTFCDYTIDFDKDENPDFLFLVRIGYNSYDPNIFKEGNITSLHDYYKVIPTDIWRSYYKEVPLIYEVYFYGTSKQNLYAIFNVSKARSSNYANCKIFKDNFKDYTLWWGENSGCTGTGLDYCMSTGARVYSYCDINKRSAWLYTKKTHDEEGWPLYYFAKEIVKDDYKPLKINYKNYELTIETNDKNGHSLNENIECYDATKFLRKISCDELLDYNRTILINKKEDIKMEIINPKPLENKKAKIILKKLDEKIGKIKIQAAIENVSFEKAIVYVPVKLDKNRQIIKTFKNGKPYVIPKYYLVYEFNETDPIFESEVPTQDQNKKENKNSYKTFNDSENNNIEASLINTILASLFMVFILIKLFLH